MPLTHHDIADSSLSFIIPMNTDRQEKGSFNEKTDGERSIVKELVTPTDPKSEFSRP